MGNNSVPKFIFRLSRFPVYRGSVLGRFYCTKILWDHRLICGPSLTETSLCGVLETEQFHNLQKQQRCMWPCAVFPSPHAATQILPFPAVAKLKLTAAANSLHAHCVAAVEETAANLV